jgi:adenosylmethionine-8-amino-7-oxononanoate aminotransferase
MFACELFGVVPDILTSGKGLSGGVFPMGIMAARERMADAFYGKPEDHLQFAHGHTWASNPLGCAVGMKTIDLILRERMVDRAVSLGDYLVAGLERLRKYGVIARSEAAAFSAVLSLSGTHGQTNRSRRRESLVSR